jgi:hypothetical protein
VNSLRRSNKDSFWLLSCTREIDDSGLVIWPHLEDHGDAQVKNQTLAVAIGIFGIGIGVLSSFADGAYSALCLFLLPVLVALAGASIVSDFNTPNEVKKEVLKSKPRVSESRPLLDITAARWQKQALHEAGREWTHR